MNKIEKVKLAVDVALYYFTITTVLSLLSRVLSDLLFSSSMELIAGFRSNTLRYVVLIAVILFLAIFSSVLKGKIQWNSSIDSKPLLFIIVGLLLIVNGLIDIPSHVSLIRFYLSHLYSVSNRVSEGTKIGLIETLYWHIVPVMICAFQIGTGAYFIRMAINRDKQLEETH